VGLVAILGVLATATSAGITANPTAVRSAHLALAPFIPAPWELRSPSNNSSSSNPKSSTGCFTYNGVYYCFPEEADWSNCPFDGLDCYNTWHFSVDVVVPQAPSDYSSSSVGLWIGLENKQCWGLASGNCVLLQTVLDYSDDAISAFGEICINANGGDNCNTLSLFDVGTAVFPGDTLELDIWDTSSGADCWNVEAFDLTTGFNSGGLNDKCQYNWGWQMPIATFAMEDHDVPGECQSSYYPYEPSSKLPLPIKSPVTGNWFLFNHASLNPNIVGEDDNVDLNCLGWESTYEEPQYWEAFNMPS
jgi:hypothetical protein